VQLAASLEQRLGDLPRVPALDDLRTLGELRQWVGGSAAPAQVTAEGEAGAPDRIAQGPGAETQAAGTAVAPLAGPREESGPVYLRWPWSWPIAVVRSAFLGAIAQPLIWFLAKPRVVGQAPLLSNGPLLVIGNHVTAYDGPLIAYALPGAWRRHLAIAMSAEMLEDFRHSRHPERKTFMLFGSVAYFLLSALYNVFPLPRQKDFQRSFAHAGEALDRGMHVMVFPEGTRSATGSLARFRPGIGLLVKQSRTAVLPVAIRGLDALKAGRSGWFRSGKIEVHVGRPLRFGDEQSEAEITARLYAEVRTLLDDPTREA